MKPMLSTEGMGFLLSDGRGVRLAFKAHHALP
jgi:hypothetical protein